MATSDSVLLIPASLLVETFGRIRTCGQGRRECVLYWLGPATEQDRVDEVVHPVHSSRGGGYTVDDRWLTQFWFELPEKAKSVRAQVHSHPRLASHSQIDDDWALIHTPGFVSLVIPRFGLGPVTLDDTHAAVRTISGWAGVEPFSVLRIV